MEKMTVQQFAKWLLDTQDLNARVQVLVEHVDHHNPSSCSTSWECFDPELHVNLVDSPKKLGGEKWLELGKVIY